MNNKKATVEEKARFLASQAKVDPQHGNVWWVPSNTKDGSSYRVQFSAPDGVLDWITCSCEYGVKHPNAGRPGCSHAYAVLTRVGLA